MNQTASQGGNRTGIESSEGRSEAMQAGTAEFPPSSSGSSAAAGKTRVAYAREHGAERGLGSVPPPIGLKGKTQALLENAQGHHPTLFMDKLGERIAFERTGTRLYEALLSKHEAHQGYPGGPSRQELLDILNEEHRHFVMLSELMTQLGGDPTAMTPSADLAAIASHGIIKVITDPRTTLLQSLEAILIAELADRDGWEALVDLARQADKEELVRKFHVAEKTELQHLSKVRHWIAAGQGRIAQAAQ